MQLQEASTKQVLQELDLNAKNIENGKRPTEAAFKPHNLNAAGKVKLAAVQAKLHMIEGEKEAKEAKAAEKKRWACAS